MLRGNTIPGLWEKLIKYKCLAPAQKRFPNVLVEGVGGGLANDKINKTPAKAFTPPTKTKMGTRL